MKLTERYYFNSNIGSATIIVADFSLLYNFLIFCRDYYPLIHHLCMC